MTAPASTRIERDFRDSSADESIERCLCEQKSFAMIAGAGSGKTTSLVRALNYLRRNESPRLRREEQCIACITFTKRARDVVINRVQSDPVVVVSTIHSFLWSIICRLTPNIRRALQTHLLPCAIEKEKEKDNGGKSQAAVRARERVASLLEDIKALDGVKGFRYSDSDISSYPEGELGHKDVIALASHLIASSELLQQVIGQQYPYIFVDEAQDAFPEVVNALNKVCESQGLPIIGYFGDPMQQIYDEGCGDFSGPDGSERFTKKENYRSSLSVIRLLNSFRSDVQQVAAGGNQSREGSVQFLVVQSEEPEGQRRRYSDAQLDRAVARFENAIDELGWSKNDSAKHLFLTWQMIARRAGFSAIQRLFKGEYASRRAEEQYDSGEHYLLIPFIRTLYPLVRSYRDGDVSQTLRLAREHCPAFTMNGRNAHVGAARVLESAKKAFQELSSMWETAALRDILNYSEKTGICRFSERLSEDLQRPKREEEYDKDIHSMEKGDWLADEFLEMSTGEVGPFVDFVSENTAYSTQHGVKGEEYEDVLVMFDDVESAWNKYNFAKLLAPTTGGEQKESQRERSRKLAYVCFSRAEINLRVVIFSQDAKGAMRDLIEQGLCNEPQVSILSGSS